MIGSVGEVAFSGRFDREPGLFLLTLSRLLHHRMGILGIIGISTMFIVALFAPLLAPYDPLEMDKETSFAPPFLNHPFGTDNLGRDLFSRVIHGARLSVSISLSSVVVGAVIGVGSGLLAGYFGGISDTVIMRVWDTLLAFPPIFLGIATAAMLGPGTLNVVVAVSVINMPTFARIARSKMLSEKEKDYVLAARSIGVEDRKIVFRHVLPNCLPPILVQMAVAMAAAVLLEAALSFVGLGSQPPQPSWGVMLKKSLPYLYMASWYGFFPGAVLSIFVLALNFFADALRDCLDPRYIGGGRS